MLTASATILHLSDLHLGQSFNDSGLADKAGGISAKGLISAYKHRGLMMQSHNGYIVAGLHTEIRLAARSVGSPEDSFDFHVITGDISTNANSEERFAFARKFLTEKVKVSEAFSTGLGLSRDKVLCVPGNHDKMNEVTLERYLKAFGDLPESPPYAIETHARSGQRFIFYGIDSNVYSEGNVAVGKIHPETLGWLGEQLEKPTKNDHQDNTVRILLLHHHPANLNPFRRLSWKTFARSFFDNPFTTLLEGERILNLCAGKIDIIMHGHEHFPIVFLNKDSGCIVVSGGTASEFQSRPEHKNSFHTLVFYQRKFRIIQFDWAGAHFKASREWTGNLDVPGCDLRSSVID